jgi:chromosome segregation ATPase
VKKVLPNLLLVLALALCALCGFQWVREAHLRAEVASLQQTNQIQAQSLANAEALTKRYEAEISRLDGRVKELKLAEQTNSATLVTLQTTLRKTEAEAGSLRQQIAGYKEAVDRQNENIKKQNEVITREGATIQEQNETLRRLAGERTELVEKLNARTREFNEVVAKYNDLVQQVEQLQKKAANK